MIYTIDNGKLRLEVSSLGAEMQRLSSCSGTEYLWDGDSRYWRRHAPVLFPFVARLKDDRYRLEDREYTMPKHGFAPECEFEIYSQSDTQLIFRLTDNEKTREYYPFAFEFCVSYRLEDWKLNISYRVFNSGDRLLPFGMGGHPGFRIPFAESPNFEDYYLEFSQVCDPDRVLFGADCLVSGVRERYPLKEGRILPLEHSLFDNDAVVLEHTAKEVAIRCRNSRRGIKVAFPQMNYVGFWHKDGLAAPYVCIEPWLSLPARHGVTEDFYCKGDMVRLKPGENYENQWSISIEEDQACMM